MKKQRIIVVILILMILITGCSRKKDTDTSSEKVKGRYMEHEVSLPEGVSKNSVIQLTKKNGLPFLYVFTGKDKCSVTAYQMNKNGTWTEATPEWLKSLIIPTAPYSQVQVVEDSNGKQFLYYAELINDSFKGHLLCSTDGSTYKTLHPEGWEDKDSKTNIYQAPNKITILEDGTLVALFYREIVFYDKETYKIQNNLIDKNYDPFMLYSNGKSLILGKQDNNTQKLTGIDVYDTENNYKLTSYPFQSNLSGSTFIDMDEKKEFVLCNPDGIHVIEKGTTLWQTVVDGTLNSLSSQTIWCTGFITDSEKNYYASFQSNDGCYSIKKYIFDKTVNSIPTTELTIYSLKDNATLRQAANIFQQQNPDVKVSFTIAMTDEEYKKADNTRKEDYIRTLNTELLTGGGADILVLDELPKDSYIDKGALVNINSVIKPMTDKGELFSNIVNNYIKDDKIYYVPTRFSLNLLCSRVTDTEKLSTLEDLTAYIKGNKDNSLIEAMTADDFITTFSPYLTYKIMDKDKKIKKETLVSLLNQLKIISDNCGIVDEYSEDGKGNNIWDIASHTKLSILPVSGIIDSMSPMSIVTYVNGCFQSFENSYIPNCELGINNASKHKDLCKKYISLVLSEEIQVNDLYDGFAINKQALTKCSQADFSSYQATTDIENEDGSTSMLTFKPLNKEQMEKLLKICSMVTNESICDGQLITTLKEETKDYFQGNCSAEETADKIIQKSSIYLSE